MKATQSRSDAPATLSEHLVAQLVSGYSEESTLYQLLFGLTSRQRRSLGDGGDLSEFVELVDQKEALLTQIVELEAELEPLRSSWMAVPGDERERVAERLNPVLDEIISSIQRTVELEHDNERLLEVRRRELHRALNDARRWRCQLPDPVPAAPPPPPPPSTSQPLAMMA